jgi:hypothetical protein
MSYWDVVGIGVLLYVGISAMIGILCYAVTDFTMPEIIIDPFIFFGIIAVFFWIGYTFDVVVL